MIALFRLVPSWVWTAILLAAMAVYFGIAIYGKGINYGRADVQADWDASVERGKAELAKIEREYRAQEHRHAADMARIGREHQEALSDAKANADRTAADLLAGTIRLQKQWRGCPASGVPGVGPGAIGADEDSGLQAASVGRIDRAVSECEAHVVSLQQVTQRDRSVK